MSGAISRRTFLRVAGGAAIGATVLGGAGYAATWAPAPDEPACRIGDGTMGKALVVYGTGSGCTAGVAERIAKSLAQAGMSVEVAPARKAPAPVGVDAVIVGSGVRAGSWHAPARQWVVRNAAALAEMPVAMFTVGLTPVSDPGRAGELKAVTDPLCAETGVKPLDVGAFAGWNEPASFSFIERAILSAMKAPRGDFRDWDAIDAWAESVGARLAG